MATDRRDNPGQDERTAKQIGREIVEPRIIVKKTENRLQVDDNVGASLSADGRWAGVADIAVCRCGGEVTG